MLSPRKVRYFVTAIVMVTIALIGAALFNNGGAAKFIAWTISLAAAQAPVWFFVLKATDDK